MLVCAAVVALLSIAALITSQFGRYAGRQSGDSDEMAACDAALDYAYTQWKTYTNSYMHYAITKGPGALTATNSNKAPASNWIYPANETPMGTGNPGVPGTPNPMAVSFNSNYGSTYAQSGVTCFNLQVMSTDQNGQPSSYDTNGTPIFSHTIIASASVPTSNVPGYPGWTGATWYYVAVAGVNAASHFGNPHPVSACRYFQVTKVPLFQAAIFYENKLELHPGATMVVSGLVHSNGDIWARGFAPLQFKGAVSYLGAFTQTADINIIYGWDGSNYGWLPGLNNQPNMGKASGLQQIDLSGYYPLTWSDGNSYSSANGSVGTGQLSKVTTAIDPFGGASTNANGLHDMVEVPTTPDPTKDQIAYNNASIRVMINDTVSPPYTTSGGVTTMNPAYLTMTDNSNNTIASSSTLYQGVAAALGNGMSQSFQDLREQATVTTTTVDMAKLATATGNASTMLYIHYTPRTGTGTSPALASNVRRAIRLSNGATLSQDVTVATDNGLYIQGDYNTGGTSSTSNGVTTTNTPSNSNGSSSNTATNYTWRAAAVMADAVTILSNNWSDANAGNTNLNSRQATATTVNCAVVAGDVTSNSPSAPGYGNGGAHNFPRFLENWGNVNFTYYGSLVEAFHSQSFTGQWQTGSVYNWPNRLWNFDTNLVNNRYPVGVPSGLQFTRGRWQRVTVNSNT